MNLQQHHNKAFLSPSSLPDHHLRPDIPLQSAFNVGGFLAGKSQCEISVCVLPHSIAMDEHSREKT